MTRWLIISGLLALGAQAESVSWKPPAAYKTQLAPLLTRSEDALTQRQTLTNSDKALTILLDETVRRVDESGRSLLALHQVRMACNEAGAQRMAREIYSYRKGYQKIHLALARSFAPDGTIQPAAPNGVFLQSPQREAEDSLYDDNGELVIIFPQVKPQTVTESIVVIEEHTPRIPGETTALLHMDAPSPLLRVRHVVELPESMANRLRIVTRGTGIPEPQRVVVGSRVRWTWERGPVAERRWEEGRAPTAQVGPVVWLSTLTNWNRFAGWYTDLLTGREDVRPALAAQVEAWTHGLTNQAEVVATLFEKVARDVRYTGLEFGRAGFQPHEPDEVWTHLLGDCKDKANLLRALLRVRHIQAHLALLNTEHTGLIIHEAPDYRQFDHMILALPQAGGGYRFCDPTITRGQPGMLRPDSADREALLLKPDGAVFVHTPTTAAGTTDYSLDLKRGADGSLSGWLTLQADGYLGAWYANHFATQDQDQRRERATSLIREFYRGADLIDLDPKHDRLRAYFVVPGNGTGDEGRGSLAFPWVASVLPDLGDVKQRQTDYFLWPGHYTVHSRIELPRGWNAAQLPHPFQVDTPAASLASRWDGSNELVIASLDFRPKQRMVNPETFTLLFDAANAAQAWLSRPLALAISSNLPPTLAAETLDPTDFPLMPTGEGQLDLMDSRFPLETQPTQRREALQRILQWFPADKATRFVANLRLAELDLTTNPTNAVVLKQSRQLLEAARKEVDTKHYSWGEYLLAGWLYDAGQTNAGLTMLNRLVSDKKLTAFRRSRSAVRAAGWLEETKPAEAARLLRATLDLPSTDQPRQHALLARVLLRLGETNELRSCLTTVATNKPDNATLILGAVVKQLPELLDGDHGVWAQQLADILAPIIAGNPDLVPLQPPLQEAQTRLAECGAYNKLRAALQVYAKDRMPAAWRKVVIEPQLKTREQFLAAIEKEEVYDRYFRLHLEYLIRFAPDPQNFGERLWKMMANMDTNKVNASVQTDFLDFCDQLPMSDSWHHEGRITRARGCLDRGDRAGALAVYTALAQEPQAPLSVRHAALRLSGAIYEDQQDYDRALAAYRPLETNRTANFRNHNPLLRAVFIQLEQGRPTEALRIAALLDPNAKQLKDYVESPAQLQELAAMSRTPPETLNYWKHQETWWPAWQALSAEISPSTPLQPVIIPLIPDPVAAGQQLRQDVEQKDRAAFVKHWNIVMHAARWEPSYLIEAVSTSYSAIQVAPERIAAVHALALRMLQDQPSKDSNIVRRVFLLKTIHYYDINRADAALQTVQAYRATYDFKDEIGRGMARLWGLSARKTRTECVPAADTLAQILKAPGSQPDRADTVFALAALYRQLDRVGDEMDLLRRELHHPEIAANAQHAERIQQRLLEVSREGEGSRKLSAAVADWLRQHPLPWFDFTEPHDLRDPRFADFDRLLTNAPAEFLPAEQAKLGLLLAQDSAQPYSRRLAGLNLAISRLVDIARQQDEVRALYDYFQNNTNIEASARAPWLWSRLFDSSTTSNDMTVLVKHPLTTFFSERQKALLDDVCRANAVNPESVEAEEKFAAELLAQPLNNYRAAVVLDAIQTTLALDNLPAAERIYAQLSHATFETDASQTPSGLQLEALRLLSHWKKILPMSDALHAAVLAHHPSENLSKPAGFDNLRDLDQLDHLDPEQARQIRLYRVQQRRLTPPVLRFWADLVDGLPSAERLALGAELFQIQLSKAADDNLRADAATFHSHMVDLDDSDSRAKLLTWFNPYRNPETCPLTYSVIKIFDVTLALRLGQPVNVDEALVHLQHPYALYMARWIRLKHYSQAHNLPALKRLLEGFTPEQLMDSGTIKLILPSLEAVGMSDEAALVRTTAEKQLYRATIKAWCSLQQHDIISVFMLAKALQKPAAIQPAWLSYCLHTIRDPALLAQIRLHQGALQSDWPATLAAAEECITGSPRDYILYWYQGLALTRLNRKTEAVAPLETFVRYAKNELEYPQAVALLQELKQH